MNKEKIVDAFNAFVDERYADSEEILRTEIKQSVNDHLKTKLELKDDPISSPDTDVDDAGDDADTEE